MALCGKSGAACGRAHGGLWRSVAVSIVACGSLLRSVAICGSLWLFVAVCDSLQQSVQPVAISGSPLYSVAGLWQFVAVGSGLWQLFM